MLNTLRFVIPAQAGIHIKIVSAAGGFLRFLNMAKVLLK